MRFGPRPDFESRKDTRNEWQFTDASPNSSADPQLVSRSYRSHFHKFHSDSETNLIAFCMPDGVTLGVLLIPNLWPEELLGKR